MRTYKEYYNLANKQELEWYRNQTEEWWREDEKPYTRDSLNIKGDYLETVRIKSKYERNNSSIVKNHTNINNWEASILFSILGQALIDWLIENKHTNVWSFGFNIERTIDGTNDLFEISYKVRYFDYDKEHWVKCEDEDELLKFAPCAQFLTDIVYEFISRQGYDIPLDWNRFGFGLDELTTSCKYGEWCCFSDGSMGLGCRYGKGYDQYIECL